MTTFNFEWGGTADLTVEEIWPDGDAPENPTTADVIQAMLKAVGQYGGTQRLASHWDLEIQDVEVSGPGGWKSLDQAIRDRRKAAADAPR